jgi:cytochrome c-type biogenesis protein CcmF
VGIVMIFVGIVASSIFRVEKQEPLEIGQELPIAGYVLRYEGVEDASDPHVEILRARVAVFSDSGESLGMVYPEKRFYRKPEQPTTEVSIRSTLAEDLYVILASYEPESGLGIFQVYVNPLIAWMWIGGWVLALGTGICVWPSWAERTTVATTRSKAEGTPTDGRPA